MKQTMFLKLIPTPQQHVALLATMHAFNAACNHVAQVAFELRSANKFDLQKVVYGTLRTEHGLPAQLAIRAISKTVEAYKQDKEVQPSFRSEGAIVYDPRVMSFKGPNTVSLLTLSGRVLVPFWVGGYQQARMAAIQGQADLIYRRGDFYLAVTLEMPERPPDIPEATLGVDLGIVNLATDSDGETFSGPAVEHVRQKMTTLRTALQRKRTRSAKRHLKRLGQHEQRFRRNTNHVISKRLVNKAVSSHRGIALEDLRHIRSRTEGTVRKSQRQRHSSWAFANSARSSATRPHWLVCVSIWLIPGTPRASARSAATARRPTARVKRNLSASPAGLLRSQTGTRQSTSQGRPSRRPS